MLDVLVSTKGVSSVGTSINVPKNSRRSWRLFGVVTQDGDGATGRLRGDVIRTDTDDDAPGSRQAQRVAARMNYPRAASAGCEGEMVQWPL